MSILPVSLYRIKDVLFSLYSVNQLWTFVKKKCIIFKGIFRKGRRSEGKGSMSDLILYLGITLVGYFFGAKFNDKKEKFFWIGTVQTAAIIVLVLFMGMRMGANREITDNIGAIGIYALVMTIFTMALSILFITITRKIFGIDKKGYMQSHTNPSEKAGKAETVATATGAAAEAAEKAGAAEGARAEFAEEAGEELTEEIKTIEEKESGIDKMTFFIIGAVIIGMVVGYFCIRPIFGEHISTFETWAGIIIKVGLCVLLFFVGTDLGFEGTVVENFKKVGIRIFAFPLAVVLGTLLGAAIAGIIMGLDVKLSLAIGAGFGWYTLAPGIIMEAGYLTGSAISFLHNVMREFFSILLIPFVASKVGYIETCGMPGAAAMDVCLPIVERSTRSEIAIYSFVSGVVLSILVPVLVPLLV